ncbi:unnamed protein product [Sphacelaria rigidula]
MVKSLQERAGVVLFRRRNPSCPEGPDQEIVQKNMFLAAVARPRHNTAAKVAFNGKIGCCAFVERAPAAHNSRNCATGRTLVTKCVEVTEETYKAKLIAEFRKTFFFVISECKYLRIRQDKAKPHRVKQDQELLAACSSHGFKLKLTNQPPDSPDTNILNLGFFASIQSLSDRMRARENR